MGRLYRSLVSVVCAQCGTVLMQDVPPQRESIPFPRYLKEGSLTRLLRRFTKRDWNVFCDLPCRDKWFRSVGHLEGPTETHTQLDYRGDPVDDSRPY